MKIKFNEVNCTNSDPGLAYVDGYPTIAIYDKNNNYFMSYNNLNSFWTNQNIISVYLK